MSDETPQGPPPSTPPQWGQPAPPPGGGGIPGAAPAPPYGGYAGSGAPPAWGSTAGSGETPYAGMYTPYAARGAPVGPGGLPLANYGLRLAGWLIDFILVGIVNALILWPLHAYHRTHLAAGSRGMAFHTGATGILIPAAIVLVYGMLLCGSARGQTLGMMLVRVRVVDANSGGPIGMARALGRGAFEYVAAFVLFIPWVVDMLFPLWDQRRQTLHDKVTNAVVVRV